MMKQSGNNPEKTPAAQPAEPPAEKPASGRRRGKRALLIGCIVLLAILAAVIGYSVWERPPEVDKPDPTAQTDPDTDKEPDSEDDFAGALNTGRSNGMYTFLLVGSDDGNGNTDTILVGRMDTVNHTVNVVSIPRDTMVNNGWKQTRRINAVYWGTVNSGGVGIEGLKKQIRNVMGFDIDCYGVIDLSAFVEVIDAMGGVDFDVPFDMDYDDPTQDLHIHLKAGPQHLDGQSAIGVVRYRYGNTASQSYVNGDLGRIEMQQSFLKSVASQMISLGNIPNLSKVIDILTDRLDTNLTAANMAFFARQLLKCSSDDIHFYTAPVTGRVVNSASYVCLNVNEWLELVNEHFNPYNEPVTTANVDIVYYSSSAGGYVATSGTVRGPGFFASAPAEPAQPTDTGEAGTGDAGETGGETVQPGTDAGTGEAAGADEAGTEAPAPEAPADAAA